MRYIDSYTVISHDVDVNDNMKPSQVFKYLQEAAMHQMWDRKPSYYDFFFEGKSFVVTRMSVEILKQMHQYDKLEIGTWNCPAKMATLKRSYDIRVGGEVVVRAYSEWATADIETGELYKASDVDFSNYEKGDVIDLDIPKKFRIPRDLEFRHVGSRHIQYSEVDMNGHMNNTNYPNMLWDYIPGIERKEVTSVNVRFMKEARLGSDLEIFMAQAEPSFGGDPRAEEKYVFRSTAGGRTNVEMVFGVRPTPDPLWDKLSGYRR